MSTERMSRMREYGAFLDGRFIGFVQARSESAALQAARRLTYLGWLDQLDVIEW